jgi:pimeloyl-ACP methyl ester carboxylesterase
MQSVIANGVTLSYVDEGRGEPVVFVHGSLDDYRSWRLQAGDFSRDRRTISYSRRCHHPNPWSDYPQEYSIRTERDDLISLLSELKLDRSVDLVGSSYGAFVALLAAQQRPDLIRSLVLGEPPIFSLLLESKAVHYPEPSFEMKVIAPLRENDYERGVRGFVDFVRGEVTYDRLSSETKERMLQNAKTLLYELTTPERDPFSIDDAHKIRTPTLLLNGENSPFMFQVITQELRKALPMSEIAVVRNASHSMHAQNPMEYDARVAKFHSSL